MCYERSEAAAELEGGANPCGLSANGFTLICIISTSSSVCVVCFCVFVFACMPSGVSLLAVCDAVYKTHNKQTTQTQETSTTQTTNKRNKPKQQLKQINKNKQTTTRTKSTPEHQTKPHPRPLAFVAKRPNRECVIVQHSMSSATQTRGK